VHINIEVCSKDRRRREIIRKRKSCLIKKINQLHTLCNVDVVLLIRLDHEILFYSSDININYSAIIVVSFADLSSVKRSLIISIQVLHWKIIKINIFKLDNLVKQQKSIIVAENYNFDILHNRTHSLFARSSDKSSICYRCSSSVSTDERSSQESNAIVDSVIIGNKERSTRVLFTRSEEEEITICTDQLNCLRKRDKVCLKLFFDLKSTLRVTRFSIEKLRRQTRLLTRLKMQRDTK